MFVVAFVFAIKSKEYNSILSKIGILLAVLTSSCFSYPLKSVSINYLLFMGFLFISSALGNDKFSLAIVPIYQKAVGIASILICIFWFNLLINRIKSEIMWKNAYTYVREKQYDDAYEIYSNLQKKMHYSPWFLFNYGAELVIMQKYHESIEVLNLAKESCFDIDLNVFLGTSYEKIGMLDESIDCFEQAAFMIPTRYIPRYKLVLLYEKVGRIDDALVMAQQIIDMPIKVKSDLVFQIKDEMLSFIVKHKKTHSIHL